jgi:hypothetical protein
MSKNAENIMISSIRGGVNIADCHLKSTKKAEPFLTLPEIVIVTEKLFLELLPETPESQYSPS